MFTCCCLGQLNVFTNEAETTHRNTCRVAKLKKGKPRRRTVRQRSHPAAR